MEALREYSPSDEETHVAVVSKKSYSQSSKSPRQHPSSPTAETSQKKRRKHSPSKKRSRSPPPHRESPSVGRRSPPLGYRRRSPPPRKGHPPARSSHGDRRRSPSPSRHPRHRSRSPTRRNNTDTRCDKKSHKSGGKHDHHTATETWSNDDSLTPEQKLEQALAAAKAKPKPSVPGLPGYINPNVVNPQHFKVVQEKRKLLWGKGKEENQKTKQSWNKWESASFEGDNQGETQSKFRRLMGIKDSGDSDSTTDCKAAKKSNQLLDNLEAQYEASRFMTHLAKGVGLGYGLNAQITQSKVNPNDTDDINESHHR